MRDYDQEDNLSDVTLDPDIEECEELYHDGAEDHNDAEYSERERVERARYVKQYSHLTPGPSSLEGQEAIDEVVAWTERSLVKLTRDIGPQQAWGLGVRASLMLKLARLREILVGKQQSEVACSSSSDSPGAQGTGPANRGAKWDDAQDREVARRFKNKESIRSISEAMGRTPLGIARRVEKVLNLEQGSVTVQ